MHRYAFILQLYTLTTKNLHWRLLAGACWYLCLEIKRSTIAEMVKTQAMDPSTMAAKIPLLMPDPSPLVIITAEKEITINKMAYLIKQFSTKHVM